MEAGPGARGAGGRAGAAGGPAAAAAAAAGEGEREREPKHGQGTGRGRGWRRLRGAPRRGGPGGGPGRGHLDLRGRDREPVPGATAGERVPAEAAGEPEGGREEGAAVRPRVPGAAAVGGHGAALPGHGPGRAVQAVPGERGGRRADRGAAARGEPERVPGGVHDDDGRRRVPARGPGADPHATEAHPSRAGHRRVRVHGRVGRGRRAPARGVRPRGGDRPVRAEPAGVRAHREERAVRLGLLGAEDVLLAGGGVRPGGECAQEARTED